MYADNTCIFFLFVQPKHVIIVEAVFKQEKMGYLGKRYTMTNYCSMDCFFAVSKLLRGRIITDGL